jgi:hypothetical protein
MPEIGIDFDKWLYTKHLDYLVNSNIITDKDITNFETLFRRRIAKTETEKSRVVYGLPYKCTKSSSSIKTGIALLNE